MNLKLLFERARIAADAIFRNLLYRVKKCSGAEKRVLIVFQQVFGDAVILSGSLNGYTQLYPKMQGYEVILLARPAVIHFMKEVLPVPEDIRFEEVDFKRFLEDYAYYKTIVKRYKSSAEILIVPGTSLSAEIFSAASNIPRKVGLMRPVPLERPWMMALFTNIAYTERVQPDSDMMMLQRHRLLLRHLGHSRYQATLATVIPQARIVDDIHYAVVCIGSSAKEKCWPEKRFAAVIDYIICNYHMKIHLCGGAEEKLREMTLMKYTKYADHIISHIGTTTFSQWSAIIQYADLVLGNDSAAIHIAAASKTPDVICIHGAYDKGQFCPYKVDILQNDERYPIMIMHDASCAQCRTRGYYFGYQKSACKDAIHNGKCVLCIDSITVSEVIAQVDNALAQYKTV